MAIVSQPAYPALPSLGRLKPLLLFGLEPEPVSNGTLVLWGSIGSAALVEAYDKDGKVVDTAKRDKVPERTGP